MATPAIESALATLSKASHLSDFEQEERLIEALIQLSAANVATEQENAALKRENAALRAGKAAAPVATPSGKIALPFRAVVRSHDGNGKPHVIDCFPIEKAAK